MVEHLNRNEEVRGSTPLDSTTLRSPSFSPDLSGPEARVELGVLPVVLAKGGKVSGLDVTLV